MYAWVRSRSRAPMDELEGKPTQPVPYVLRLADASATRAGLSGQKAANLGDLANAGFPVPNGYVLTTDAFARFVIENNCQGDVSTDDLKNAKFPRDVSATLDPILSGLGGAALAVRSSATGEDLPGASFAGQFETVLGVRERSELEAAILECWKSAFANRVKAYAERRGSTDETRMAVLIQRLVPARAAGVAFTANPVTGNRDEVVINAVRGLGDKLVSGETTPDEWVFRNDTAIRRSSPHDALTASDAESV